MFLLNPSFATSRHIDLYVSTNLIDSATKLSLETCFSLQLYCGRTNVYISSKFLGENDYEAQNSESGKGINNKLKVSFFLKIRGLVTQQTAAVLFSWY